MDVNGEIDLEIFFKVANERFTKLEMDLVLTETRYAQLDRQHDTLVEQFTLLSQERDDLQEKLRLFEVKGDFTGPRDRS